MVAAEAAYVLVFRAGTAGLKLPRNVLEALGDCAILEEDLRTDLVKTGTS